MVGVRRRVLLSLRRWRRAKSRSLNFSAGVGASRRSLRRFLGGAAPEVGEVGFAVGEELGVFGEEGCGAAGVEEDADEFAEVDGVDLLVVGVDAEEEGGGRVLEGVGGVVGVGEVVAGE
jgi:hypothetical protein